MLNASHIHDVIIIGSGPAGYTAAIYASRANLKPIMFAGYQSGGQLMQTTDVENFPGFPEGIKGPELMANMRKQAERFGTEIIEKDVTSVDFSGDIKKVTVESTEYQARTVIIASGAAARWLDIPVEEKYKGRGVSTCATCDGAFFNGKVVGVVGGGDSAMEEANFLTRFATKVYLIHRRDEFRASKIMQDRVKSNPKIEIVLNSEVVDMHGEPNLSSVTLNNTVTGEKKNLDLDGLFIAIGHTPMTGFLADVLEKKDNGYLKLASEISKSSQTEHSDLQSSTKEPAATSSHLPLQTQSSIEGVFIAGDVHDHVYRQAITAAGEGCKAAIDAERYLESLGQ